MQPFQCDLQTQTQETHRTTYTGPSSVAKHIEGTKRPQPHPPHRRGTFHRRLQPLYTEKHKVSCSGFLPTTKPMQHSCSHSNAICKHKLKKRIELRTQEHPVLQNTLKERNDPSRTRRTDEVPFIVACSHFTRKNARFRAPASSPQQSPCNIHAAIPMRSATTNFKKRIELRTQDTTTRCKTHWRNETTPAAPAAQTRYLSSPAAATLHGKTQGFVLRLPPHNKAHATSMQPFQCDLQTQTQETHRTTYAQNNHCCKTHRRNATKRPQPHPPHRQGTFHRRLQPLYTEKHKVSCAGFLPTTKPMQHSCSHSNAICKHKLKKRIELRTQEHPVLQNTLKERNDPSRTRRTDEVPFIVACSHFTRKNTRFRAPASSPQQSPCNIHAAIPMRSANTNSRNA